MPIIHPLNRLPVHIDEIRTREHPVQVLRDDLLPGGSKQRAATPYLKVLLDKGFHRFVYASPFCGFAQVALAVASNELGAECTIYCEEDKSAQVPGKLHPFAALASQHGATVLLVETLEEAHDRATTHAKLSGSYAIPLGFGDSCFRKLFETALADVWLEIQRRSVRPIQRVWVPVGSGTLARCLRKVIDVELCLVDVRVLPSEDPRLLELKMLQNTTHFRSSELFNEPCQTLPPIPSNLHYDAKLWRWINEQSTAGDLWWNVSR